MRAALVLSTALAALLTGCGSKADPLPPACSDGPRFVLRALRAAPGPVRLADGTALSECVKRASDDGELQQLGFSLTPAADALVRAGTAPAAVQLGYLIGAVRRGAARTNGVHLELVRRLESTITFAAPALVAAARQGMRAGEATG